MKVISLRDSIIELIKYAGKEAYLIKNHLYLEINKDGTRFSIYTHKNGIMSITIYFSDAIYYKFFIDNTGSLFSERGSTPDLIERYGLNYIVALLENASDKLIEIGKDAINSVNYRFRDTSNDENIEEIHGKRFKKEADKLH